MLKKKPKKKAGSLAEILASYKAVTHLRLPSGQILIYSGHIPGGLYVLLSGAIFLSRSFSPGEIRPERILKAGRDCVLYPELTDLDRPSEFHAIIGTTAEVLFVPRTLLQSDKRIRNLLESV